MGFIRELKSMHFLKWCRQKPDGSGFGKKGKGKLIVISSNSFKWVRSLCISAFQILLFILNVSAFIQAFHSSVLIALISLPLTHHPIVTIYVHLPNLSFENTNFFYPHLKDKFQVDYLD